MSLINKMLKDLDQQKQADKSGLEAKEMLNSLKSSAENAASSKHNKSSKSISLYILIVLLVLVLLYPAYNYLSTNKKTTSVAKPAAEKTVKFSKQNIQQATTKIATTASVVNMAELSGYTFSSKDNIANLNLKLSSSSHYYVSQENDKRQLVVTLVDTKIAKDIPELPQNEWIQSMQIKQHGANAVLIIDVKAAVELQKIDITSDPSSQLLLEFWHPAIKTETKNVPLMSKTLVKLTPDQQVEQQYQQVLDLLQHQQVNLAIGKLRIIEGKFPEYMPVKIALTTLLYKGNHLRAALRVAKSGLALNPENMTLLKIATRILMSQKRYTAALHMLQQHAPEINDDPSYYALMALLYQQQNKYLVAAKLYDQLVKLYPYNATWWVGLGLALESAGKNNAALEAYNKALHVNVDLSPAARAFAASKVEQLS